MLDGIGKSLDPRFDISEIAAPYARELLLEGNPVGSKLQKDFLKGWANQVRNGLAGAALDGWAWLRSGSASAMGCLFGLPALGPQSPSDVWADQA